jgi:hypothetical protein
MAGSDSGHVVSMQHSSEGQCNKWEDIEMFIGIEPVNNISDRTKIAASMISDFEKFLEKQGFVLACTMIIDKAEVDIGINFVEKIPIITMFGRGMSREAVRELISMMGKSAEMVSNKSHMVGGDGNVIHND